MSNLAFTSGANSASKFEQDLEAANRRGLESEVGHIRAVAARYDRTSDNLVLNLRGGMTLFVPVHLLQGVAGQSPELIEKVELEGNGSALHFEDLDADFSVQDVAAGSFGSRSWMQQLEDKGLLDAASIERRQKVEQLLSSAASSMGNKGGRSRSKAKTDAARSNGLRGGRPRMSPSGSEIGVTGRVVGGKVQVDINLQAIAGAKKIIPALNEDVPAREVIEEKVVD